MLRGLLAGSASGLALSALLIAAGSLVAPRPAAEAHRPGAPRPAAPVLRDQADAVPRVPGTLPERGSDGPGPDAPPAVAASAPPPAMAPDDTAYDTPDDMAGDAPPVDEAATVPLPVASAFNRPREDGEVVTPASDPVARPLPPTDRLRAADTVPQDGQMLRTESAARPVEARVEGFGAAPQSGRKPTLPRATADGEPPAFAIAPPVDGSRPAREPAVAIDTPIVAPPSADPVAERSTGDEPRP